MGANGKRECCMKVPSCPELTFQLITDTAEYLGDELDTVLQNYHEYIPVGEFTRSERFEFVVSSISGAGGYTPRSLTAILKKRPAAWNAPGGSATKPVMVHSWAQVYPEQCREVSEFCRTRKHVPEKVSNNDEWCCIIVLSQVIDWALKEGRWPSTVLPTNEELSILFKEWMEYYSQLITFNT